MTARVGGCEQESTQSRQVYGKAVRAGCGPTGGSADPATLRRYYGDLFGWEFDTAGPVAESVSQQGDYGFTDPTPSSGGPGIPGGVGGGAGYLPHVVFYVGVPDVEAALQKAESLGGVRKMGPERAPGRDLVVGHFADPEGNLIGLAGPA